MKAIHILQPYHVGSRRGRSLAIIIPAEIVREYCIDTSTVFALRINANEKKVILQMLSGLKDSDQNYTTPSITDTDLKMNSQATGFEI
jgi:hypothetical protein